MLIGYVPGGVLVVKPTLALILLRFQTITYIGVSWVRMRKAADYMQSNPEINVVRDSAHTGSCQKVLYNIQMPDVSPIGRKPDDVDVSRVCVASR